MIFKLILLCLLMLFIGFSLGVAGANKANHIGMYDAAHDRLYFDDGKKPVDLINKKQRIGVIDIVYLTGRDEDGRLSE